MKKNSTFRDLDTSIVKSLSVVVCFSIALLTGCEQTKAVPVSLSPSMTILPSTHNQQTATVTPSKFVPLGSFRLDNQRVGRVIFDTKFIYWNTDDDRKRYWRLDKTTLQASIAVTSQFPDGDIGVIQPITLNDWFVFIDTRANNYSSWLMRAVNTTSGEERLLYKKEDEKLYPHPFASNGKWIVWADQTFQPGDCPRSIIYALNFASLGSNNMPRILNEACVKTDYTWNYPVIEGDIVVAERNLSLAKGGGFEIVQFNLSDPTVMQVLAKGDDVSEPDISPGFIVWKAADRFAFGKNVGFMPRSTKQVSKVTLPTEYPYLKLSDRWVYWQTAGRFPLNVFDLSSGKSLQIATLTGDDLFWGPSMQGNAIAWIRLSNWKQPHINSLIEWGEIK